MSSYGDTSSQNKPEYMRCCWKGLRLGLKLQNCSTNRGYYVASPSSSHLLTEHSDSNGFSTFWKRSWEFPFLMVLRTIPIFAWMSSIQSNCSPFSKILNLGNG